MQTYLSGRVIYIEVEHTAGLQELHDIVQLSATMADGSPLPEWLKLDPDNRILSGVSPIGVERLPLRIRAVLGDGTVLAGYVEVTPETGRVTELDALLPQIPAGARAFSEQVNSAANRFHAETARLAAAMLALR